jgi:hypothetical protein
MCTVLLPTSDNVYCTTTTGWQCVLYYCHRVTMCTVLLPPGDNVYCTTATGDNVYCTTATGWQCVVYYCHRVTMCTVLLPPGDNMYCTTATGWQCVLYYCHRVTMCTVLLPPGDNPLAVNKYINIKRKIINIRFFQEIFISFTPNYLWVWYEKKQLFYLRADIIFKSVSACDQHRAYRGTFHFNF